MTRGRDSFTEEHKLEEVALGDLKSGSTGTCSGTSIQEFEVDPPARDRRGELSIFQRETGKEKERV